MKISNCAILVCTIPSISLLRKYPYMEISLGPSILTGALKAEGHEVDYYDLNIILNNIRDAEERFSEEENKILTILSQTTNFIESPKTDSLIYKRAKDLLNVINGEKYDYICLSLERKSKEPLVFIKAILFSLILSSLLRKKYNCPIFLGGSVACYAFGVSKLENIMKEFKDTPIDGFFFHAKAREFVEFLKTLNNQLTTIVIDKHTGVIFSYKFKQSLINKSMKFKFRRHRNTYLKKFKSIYYRPCFPQQKSKEILCDFKNILPRSLFIRNPELEEIEPFYIVPFLFSWGCPFRCGFCMISSFPFGFLTAQKAVDELERIVESYRITNFRFYNSQINFNEKYVFDFCDEIKRRNLKIKFSDSGNLFFSSKEIFRALRESGCVKIWFGLETLSPRLQKIYKKTLNEDKIIAGLTNSDEAGIWNAVNLIINFPYESEAEFHKLVGFMKRNSPIIDCWECNNFMLLQDSKIFYNPSSFGVNILETEDLIKGYHFDEINGLRWEEKLERGKKLLSEFRVFFHYYKNLVFSNDYLLFGISSKSDDKLKTKDIFNALINHLQNNPELKKQINNKGNIENMNLEKYAKYIYPEFV